MEMPSHHDWVAFARDWGSLVTTTALVVITAWYAHLTRKLARSSEEASTAAKVAALASQDAVRIAQSSLEIGFRVTWHWAEGNTSLRGAIVLCEGSTVHVHELWIDRVASQPERLDWKFDDVNLRFDRATFQGPPHGGHVSLPVLLHKHESVYFYASTASVQLDASVVQIQGRVIYSVDGKTTRPYRPEPSI